jgi:outer membrane immunogenic protein
MTSLTLTKQSLKLMALSLIAIATLGSSAHAAVSDDMNSLGSNAESKKRAARLENRSRISLVQNRSVKRDWRLEGGVSYGGVAMGDSYLMTQNLGFNADLHISPKFSLGVRYAKAFSQLTNEGEAQYKNAQDMRNQGNMDYRVADMDTPESSLMGVANWYMTYGKINLFDASIIQFDIYSLAGYGQMKLSSGTTDTWTAGLGIGFWITNHITSRIELRYQNYQDQVYSGPRNLNLIVGSFGLGVLL